MSNSAGHFWRSIACSLALVGLSSDEALFAALMIGFFFSLSVSFDEARARFYQEESLIRNARSLNFFENSREL